MYDEFPKSIRVGPYDIMINISETLKEEKKYLGEFDTDTYHISLSSSQPSRRHAAGTAIHEILHVVWRVAGLRKKEKEERTISMFEIYLLQIMVDNPQLMQWLADAVQDSDGNDIP